MTITNSDNNNKYFREAFFSLIQLGREGARFEFMQNSAKLTELVNFNSLLRS